MEYIINHQLRRVAYLKFLLFFVAAIIAILVAAYFTVNLPTKENARLRDDKKTQEKQVSAEQPILNIVQNAANLIDSMNQLGQNNALIDIEIARYLDTIKNASDSKSMYAATNKAIFNILYDYNELNKEYIIANDAAQLVGKVKAELSTCENKRTEAEKKLEEYKKNNYLMP